MPLKTPGISARAPIGAADAPKKRTWSDIPSEGREVWKGLRSPEGERMVLEQNLFVEGLLPSWIRRQLSDKEMDHYRAPFANPGEDRRPTLSWPRSSPIDGEPADVVAVANDYGSWLAESDVPKLFINAEPGFAVRGRIRELIRTWPNLTETTVNGIHLIQEDSPDEIGTAVANFVRRPRRPPEGPGLSSTSPRTNKEEEFGGV